MLLNCALGALGRYERSGLGARSSHLGTRDSCGDENDCNITRFIQKISMRYSAYLLLQEAKLAATSAQFKPNSNSVSLNFLARVLIYPHHLHSPFPRNSQIYIQTRNGLYLRWWTFIAGWHILSVIKKCQVTCINYSQSLIRKIRVGVGIKLFRYSTRPEGDQACFFNLQGFSAKITLSLEAPTEKEKSNQSEQLTGLTGK